MARFYYVGSKQEDSKQFGGPIGGGMEKGNCEDSPAFVRVPPMFDPSGRQLVPLKKNGICISFAGHGFWHIGPGEYVDLPDNIPNKHIKSHCPQLLSKEEALEAGICNEDGSLKQALVPSVKNKKE